MKTNKLAMTPGREVTAAWLIERTCLLVRERKSYSQDESAGLAKVSRGTIIRIEAGYEAHPSTIRRIA